jgi:pimeloyl-ACP methyl ester carboxylesterase
MRHLLLPLALLALLPSAADARRLGSLAFEACTLAPPGTPATVEAKCTTVSVPENHAEPGGRRIELALAWVPAEREGEADPVFMLAGGPGQSARDGYPSLHGAFRDIRRKRHVLLLDQRGTGASNPLVCRDAEGKAAFTEGDDSEDLSAARAFAERCREALGKENDLRHFGTLDAIDDIEFVRAAIGAPQVNLIGISYGTRVAQHYAKRYPERSRALVLDGVVPNALHLGQEHARNLETALDLHFSRCAEDAACSERFGTVRETMARVSQSLREAPRPVRYRDPVSGESKEETLSFGNLAAVLRMFSYSPASAALLPLALHELDQGRPELLMAQSQLLVAQLGEMINHGMQLSVMCGEDVDLLRVDEADAGTVLGTEFISFAKVQCEVWPTKPRPADFHAPLRSEVPSLLLSGEYDPVTPPRYGDQVLEGLSRARHLVLRGQGHNVLPVACTPKLVARFLDTLDAAELDAACLDKLPYTPPFVGFHGWEP